MAQPITINIERSRAYTAGDAVILEIDGEIQPDRFHLWSPVERRLGFGRGPFGHGRFGRGRSLGFGRGAFGRGVFGQGVSLITLSTQNTFTAGDYTVLAKGRDQLGNDGPWSASVVHPHRPTPPAPSAASISGNTITWTWEDPA